MLVVDLNSSSTSECFLLLSLYLPTNPTSLLNLDRRPGFDASSWNFPSTDTEETETTLRGLQII